MRYEYRWSFFGIEQNRIGSSEHCISAQFILAQDFQSTRKSFVVDSLALVLESQKNWGLRNTKASTLYSRQDVM